LIDAAEKGLPFCSPKNVMKALTRCPNEELVFNSSIRLLNSFIRNNNNKCAVRTVQAISNFAINYGKEDVNNGLLDFINESINEKGSVNKEVCILLSEYSTRDDLFTTGTKERICSMTGKYECEIDPNLKSLCDVEETSDDNNEL
jgi:hypothetical protein